MEKQMTDAPEAVEAADANVRRYFPLTNGTAFMGMCAAGDTVSYGKASYYVADTDYDAARAEIERLTKERDTAKTIWREDLVKLWSANEELTTLRAKLAEAHGLIRRARYYVVKHGGTGGTDLQIDIDAALQQGSTKGE